MKLRAALRATVAASAFPYGYTLTVWTTGAVLTHARGTPKTWEALLLLVGAVAGYLTLGLIAYGGLRRETPAEPLPFAVWEALHLVPVSAAIGAATLVAHFVHDAAAWPIDGFLVTTIYLGLAAAQTAVFRR